ncbi:hypothetical protein BJ742DRAFT_777399 [Cladochytrium replicatum]|nr:hypothetical protein BJ742DRAFT_777399 [Cladochytrium replicatum]
MVYGRRLYYTLKNSATASTTELRCASSTTPKMREHLRGGVVSAKERFALAGGVIDVDESENCFKVSGAETTRDADEDVPAKCFIQNWYWDPIWGKLVIHNETQETK